MAIGGLGNFGKSPKLSTYIGGQKNRGTSQHNSIMGATSLTHVSNPAVAPLYLNTTNILSSNKVNKVYGKGRNTDHCDDDASYSGDEEDEEVHSQEEDGRKIV